MSDSNRRRKIILDFARWAAASAARQGADVRGRKLYPGIDEIDMDTLTVTTKDAWTEKEFQAWHKFQVEKLAEKTGLPVGWAAKILSMVTKVRIYMAREGDSSLLELIHPPIDNKLIDAIRSRYPLKSESRNPNFKLRELCDQGKPIDGLKTYEQYARVIEGLRMVAEREGCILFEVESLWRG